MKTWNVIPPQRPAILSAFLGAITRNLSLDRYRAGQTKKRGGHLERVWDELEQCTDRSADLENRIAMGELSQLLDQFLRHLPQRDRLVFLRRYWYSDPINEIAFRCKMTEGAVKVSLHRSRKKLRKLLEQEGYTV